MKLIVGLGNPGKKYQKTRHNVGFMIVDKLRTALEPYNISAWELSKKFNAEIASCSKGSDRIILMKPMTFMNDSGQAVQLIGSYYKLLPENIIIIHDDKDIPLGEVKTQTDRGSAGHNGVRSIIEHIGTQDFTRLRVGIRSDRMSKTADTSTFVLGKFGLFEKKKLNAAIENSIQTILSLI